jgi:hypothetical protein
MAATEKPLVYLILGAAGSGRRAVLTDLLSDGLVEGDRPAVMLAESETAAESDAKLPGLTRWAWTDGQIVGELPREATHTFFIADGRENPVEQIEVFVAWLEAQGAQIGRVITIVNCRLAEKNSALLAWYEACVHFSDIVLLNRREGVANKWMSDFQGHFKKQFVPSLFEFVKDGHVKNPALVLDPQARRMSHVFDDEQDWIFKTIEGEVIDEDEETEGDEEVEATREEEPYFARDAAGRRVKRLPDIRQYL